MMEYGERKAPGAWQRPAEETHRTEGPGEHSLVLVCRFTPDTVLTFANEAYCRYFGKTEAELVGTSFLSLVAEADRGAVRAALDELARAGKPRAYEHQVVTREGEIRWQRWVDRPLYDASGRLVEFESEGTDITEQRRGDEASVPT